MGWVRMDRSKVSLVSRGSRLVSLAENRTQHLESGQSRDLASRVQLPHDYHSSPIRPHRIGDFGSEKNPGLGANIAMT